MAYELSRMHIPFRLQVTLPVQYKQIQLDCGYFRVKVCRAIIQNSRSTNSDLYETREDKSGAFDQLQRAIVEKRN